MKHGNRIENTLSNPPKHHVESTTDISYKICVIFSMCVQLGIGSDNEHEEQAK